MKKSIFAFLLIILSMFFSIFTIRAAGVYKITCAYERKSGITINYNSTDSDFNFNDQKVTFVIEGNTIRVENIGMDAYKKYNYDMTAIDLSKIDDNYCPSSFSVDSAAEEIRFYSKYDYSGTYIHSPTWSCVYSIMINNDKVGQDDYGAITEGGSLYVPRFHLFYSQDGFEIDNQFLNLNDKQLEFGILTTISTTNKIKNYGEYQNSCPRIQGKYFGLDDNVLWGNIVFDAEETEEIFGRLREYKPNYKKEIIQEENVHCSNYKNKTNCLNNDKWSCVWVEDSSLKYGGYCNINNLQYVACGDAKDIPAKIPPIVSFVVNFLKIMAPIILIITSIITLLKALTLSEDEIKKRKNH